MLKELIKQLAIKQVELKKQRKTGTLPVFPRNSWGDISWSDIPTAQRVRLKNAMSAAQYVQTNKVRITAALNLYHELRGSTYRHNVPKDDYQYMVSYKGELATLRKEYTKTSDGTIAIP